MAHGHRSATITLFTALFAAQAALIAMSPVLAQAAGDLHVSTAAAGQLRTVTGVAAGATALLVSAGRIRFGLARQLQLAALLLALASLASAAAPDYLVLAVAQVPVGIAVAVLTTSGTLAAAEWVPSELRTRTLSWALVGQPAAWIAGMPLIGVVGASSWRYGWLVLPFAASLTVAVLAGRRAPGATAPRSVAGVRAVLRDGTIVSWLASELLANSAWAGTLVYAGALFSEVHGASPVETGIVLALGATAYILGNLTARRLVRLEAAGVLGALASAAGVAVLAFATVDCGTVARAVLFSIAASIVGGRTMVSSAFAVAMPLEHRGAVTSLRASTMQFGYVIGSSLGGIAVATGGYQALGATTATLFLLGAACLAWSRATAQTRVTAGSRRLGGARESSGTRTPALRRC
jgi:predicted MFS family arabinose efflux permease